jgi:hypothetical protein
MTVLPAEAGQAVVALVYRQIPSLSEWVRVPALEGGL